jgi:hypothetical protein
VELVIAIAASLAAPLAPAIAHGAPFFPGPEPVDHVVTMVVRNWGLEEGRVVTHHGGWTRVERSHRGGLGRSYFGQSGFTTVNLGGLNPGENRGVSIVRGAEAPELRLGLQQLQDRRAPRCAWRELRGVERVADHSRQRACEFQLRYGGRHRACQLACNAPRHPTFSRSDAPGATPGSSRRRATATRASRPAILDGARGRRSQPGIAWTGVRRRA